MTISSDAPVAEPLPLEAIQAAATRVTRQGHRLGGDNLLITAKQALAAHTINAAHALGREDDLGSLAAGKRADFAVLAVDPLSVEAGEIAEIRVLETWVDGICHFTADRNADRNSDRTHQRTPGAGPCLTRKPPPPSSCPRASWQTTPDSTS